MKKEQTEPSDYELAKQKLKGQFRTGQPLFGKDGAFALFSYFSVNCVHKYEA